MGMILDPYRYAASGGGGTDPDWANVVALLHFDGTDGSTTMTDETGKTWSVYGQAQIDTAQSQFGGSSLLLDGSGDLLSCAYSDFVTGKDFILGTGDFTIECWVRFNSVAGNQYIIDVGSNGNTFGMNSATGGTIHYYDSTTYGAGDDSLILGGPVAVINTWYYIAISKNSGTIRAFCNGVKWGEQISTYNNSSNTITIGDYGGTGYSLNGWVDEVRVTKGVGRYTADFTPPIAAFPNS